MDRKAHAPTEARRCAKKSMNSNRKCPVFVGQLALAFLMAILCYLIAMTIFGPILIEKIGGLYTKLVVMVIALAVLIGFLHFTRNENDHSSRIDRNTNRLSGSEPKGRYGLLIMAILAFIMTPFGFAGVLETRGSGYLPPLWGGSLCLISGVFLLYSFFRKRE